MIDIVYFTNICATLSRSPFMSHYMCCHKDRMAVTLIQWLLLCEGKRRKKKKNSSWGLLDGNKKAIKVEQQEKQIWCLFLSVSVIYLFFMADEQKFWKTRVQWIQSWPPLEGLLKNPLDMSDLEVFILFKWMLLMYLIIHSTTLNIQSYTLREAC